MKKKVSIIVPVYNAEKYLGKCLDSLLNQTLKDIELVIINDGSKDNSDDIIKEYKKKYNDKIVYKKIENGGVANARNTALKMASGEYIGFVDSDDFIELDMYEKLYNKAISDNSDIVVSGYFFNYETGRFKNFELGDTSLFSKSLTESPRILLNTTPFITNKIFRREFLNENDFYFEKYRIFEDLLFTYKTFIKANKISKVDECFYHYCRRKGDSVTGNFTRKFEDIYEVGNKLRKFYIDNGGEELLEYVDFIIIKHIYLRFYARVSLKEIRVKHSFVRKSIKYLNKNVPGWKNNIYFDIYENRSSNGTLSILRPYINKVMRLSKKVLRKIKNPAYIYKKYYNKPLDDNKIYLYSQKGNDINGNMFYLLRELRNNSKYDNFEVYIPVNKNRVNEFKNKLDNYEIKNYHLIKEHTRKSVKILSKSKYVFTDTSMEVFFVKKPGQVVVNTWHGTPLKTLGKAVVQEFHNISNVQKNFNISDYLLYPNEYMRKIMKRDYMLDLTKNKICMLGYPRNSVFFEEGEKHEKIRIAYLPTWRGVNLGNNSVSYLEQLEDILESIDKKLDNKYEFYISLHPYLKDKMSFDDYENIKVIPATYETYDFLNSCDILITDYSSVFFDFACTRKKIILFTYDKEEYLSDRGMYLDIDDLPFKQVDTVDKLIEEIKKPYKFDYSDFIKDYCCYDSKDNAIKLLELVLENKKKGVKLLDNEVVKNGVLLHSNSFLMTNDQDGIFDLIEKLSVKDKVYLSFINSRIRNNKLFLKRANVDYYGYYGFFSMNKLFDTFMLKLLSKFNKLYNIFPKFYDKMFKLELLRRYQDFNFSKVVLFREKNNLNIYTFAFADSHKIIYLDSLNINSKLLDKYDEIYVKSEKGKKTLISRGIDASKIKISIY